MKDPDLWNRLTGHDFPLDDKGKTLLSHLVDQTTLGKHKAPIAIQEYRKFLYLAATSGEIVAPSPLIDRLWHTHIEHTRAYFEDFCPRIIGRVIHHSPGRATAETDPAYARTLGLYEAAFGEKPFFRVWPQPKVLRWYRQLESFMVPALLVSYLIVAVASGILDEFSPGRLFNVLMFTIFWVFVPVAAVGAVTYPFIGHWEVMPNKNGSGCSGCGGGDGGGCGGD